jgi:hypothetical protein
MPRLQHSHASMKRVILRLCSVIGMACDAREPRRYATLVEGVASIAVIICARPHRESNKRAAATVVTFIPIATCITVLYAKDLADMMEELALDIGFFLTTPLVGLTICLAFVPNFRDVAGRIRRTALTNIRNGWQDFQRDWKANRIEA